MTPDAAPPLLPWAPDVTIAPRPDATLAPEGYVVTSDDGTRIHFLDWGGSAEGGEPGVLLVPGILQPAWTWAPIARRLASLRRVVVADLRGQGLSDSPMRGYDLTTLVSDMTAVAESSGLLGGDRQRIVVAGLGFGGVLAAAAAVALGARCAGLVLVDGGWERIETVTDLDEDEFLRGLDEPPEVLRSLDAFLADRRGYDPPSFDADQERAALDAVVETAAGHVVRAVRPHVVHALVRTMFEWDPAADDALPAVAVPVTALVALGGGDVEIRLVELRRTGEARAAAGRAPMRVTGFPGLGHNLPRYRPADVTGAILHATGVDSPDATT
jgi:pimeloyl-ACP methyl ester carboxylesterase